MQARFWEAVAATCRNRPAVFCYDLMNEPIVTEDNSLHFYPRKDEVGKALKALAVYDIGKPIVIEGNVSVKLFGGGTGSIH